MPDITFHPGVIPTPPGVPRLFAEDYIASDFPVKIYRQDYTDFTAPMYLNDQLGDCTCAGIGHMFGCWTKYAQSAELIFPDTVIETLYEQAAGYVPGNPSTDKGATLQQILDFVQKNGLEGHTIDAFAQLRNLDTAGMSTALKLYGSVYVAVSLPQSAEDQFNYSEPWTVMPGSPILGGHCITMQGFDGGLNSYRWCTWGKPDQASSIGWWQHYGMEAWAVYSKDFMRSGGTAPNGLNEASLLADMVNL
jgi:hypothetical protein